MTKSIEELKNIVTDNMGLKGKNGKLITTISRYPNNILMLYGKSVSWKHLQELLATSEMALDIKESQGTIFPEEKKNHGGFRLNAGRKAKNPKEKKVVKSICLTKNTIAKLSVLAKNSGKSVSSFLESLIIDTHHISVSAYQQNKKMKSDILDAFGIND